MRNLIEYINESYINESLQAQWLRKFASSINKKLSDLNRNIRWDKITDNAFQEFEPGSQIVKKQIRKIHNYDSNDIIFILSKDKSSIDYVLVYGHYIMLTNIYKKGFDYLDKSYREYDVKDMVDDRPCVLLDLDNHKEFVIGQDDPDSRFTRQKNREGMIVKTTDYWDKKEFFGVVSKIGGIDDIAKANIKRYKEILAKKHKDDIDDKGTYEKVMKCVNDVMSFLGEHNEEDKMYKRQVLIQMLYAKGGDTMRRIGSKSDTEDGLLPLYNSFLDNKGDMKKREMGQYVWNDFDTLLRYCKNDIECINKLTDEIYEFMKAY